MRMQTVIGFSLNVRLKFVLFFITLCNNYEKDLTSAAAGQLEAAVRQPGSGEATFTRPSINLQKPRLDLPQVNKIPRSVRISANKCLTAT